MSKPARILFLGLTLAASRLVAQSDPALEHANRLLRASPVIDGHNDLPWAIREYKDAPRDVDAYDLNTPRPGQTDLARLRAGHVGGQFWSVYIPGEVKDSGFARIQLEQIDIARRTIEHYPRDLELALSADDADRIMKAGRIASFLGMEGGQAIENSLGALRAYYTLGVRYMTLTHNVTLDWGDAALDSARHGGLTRFGEEVVHEMNRLGMLADLSHVSPGTMSDALDASEAPVIFSHSSARAITDVPRNVPDSILARMKQNGGVVMVTFVPSFVSRAIEDSLAAWRPLLMARLQGVTDSTARAQIRRDFNAAHPLPKATVKDVADHVEHVRDVAGIDHVGIGGDYDGTDELPVGLEDVSRFPNLFAELIRRGWSDEDLRKLANGNILRALREAERLAARLQTERRPSTKTIDQLDRAPTP